MAGPSIEQAMGPETASPGEGMAPPGSGVASGSPSAERCYAEFCELYRRFFAGAYYGVTAERAVAREIEDAYVRWARALGREEAYQLKTAARWAVRP